MGTIFDYLDWRGDLPLSVDPFNEVDSLLLTELVYAHMEDYVKPEERLTLGEAAARYFAGTNNPDFVLGVETLRKSGVSVRFKDLVMYQLETSLDEQTQFGAMCLELSEDVTYVLFRGTDETITGWREDFAISYSETPGQRMATEYLDRVISDTSKTWIVGGHSKGGNLAVYASMLLDKEKQACIREIYNFDGPGISEEYFDEEGFSRIRHKIKRYAPAYSIVGRLFEQDIPAVLVDNCASGIVQHDAKNWMVLNTHMVRTAEVPEDCRRLNVILKEWIDSADMEEREAFTKEFFDALEIKGTAETMEDFKRNGVKGIWNVLTSIVTFSPPAKRAVNKLMKSAGKNTIRTTTEKISAPLSRLTGMARQGLDSFYGKRDKLFGTYPRLEGERVLLRKMTAYDAPSLKELTQNEQVYRTLPPDLYEMKYDDKMKVINRMDRECFATQKSILLGICLLPQEYPMIGIAEIYNYEAAKQKASIGVRILPEFWGQGIGTEVISLLTHYMLDEIGLRTITAHVMTENQASAGALKKNGFRNKYPNIWDDWGYDTLTHVNKFVIKRAWLENPDIAELPVEVEKFVVDYRVEQDRIRAMLPDGYTSLRPVLRIQNEIRDEETVYLELNTPVEKDGRRGWLNIQNWKSSRDTLGFDRNGDTVQISAPFLTLRYTLHGTVRDLPEEQDNEGCYYMRDGEEEFLPTVSTGSEVTVCDCAFSWKFRKNDASGISTGETFPAAMEEISKTYRKCAMNAKNAAAIPSKEVLDTWVIRFERKIEES